MLVQRTLSKDCALAGLRVGYGLASAPLVEALSRARPPFSVNVLALAAIEAAVGRASRGGPCPWPGCARSEPGWKRPSARLGVEYFPSQANFVTARLDLDALAPALAASGTVVRSGADLGLPGWARISIGWAPQMAVLRSILYSRLGPAGPPRSCRT